MIRLYLVIFTFCLTITASNAQWNFLGGSHIGPGAMYPEGAILESDSSGNPIISDESDIFNGIQFKKYIGNSWLNLPMDSLEGRLIPGLCLWGSALSTNSANDMIIGYLGQAALPLWYRSFFVSKFNGNYWYPLGNNSGQIDNLNDSTSFLLSIAVKLSQNGTPFAAFTYSSKPNNTTKYIKVKKFNGNSWINVGLPATMQEPWVSTVKNLELFLGSNDTPYVSTELGNILKFNGTNWDSVSNAQQIFMDSQKNLYAANADAGLNPSITLKKYIGGNWITVSNSPSGCTDKIRLLALAISPTGTPHIAYENIQSKYVSIINYSGNSWQPSATNIVQYPYNAKFLFTPKGKLIIRINTHDITDSIYRWVLAYSPGTGLSSFYPNKMLNIYPNPNRDGILHLQLPENLKTDDKVFITIRDLTGKIVVQHEGAPELVDKTNVGQLASGIYVVSVSVNNILLKTFKFCKN
ncbi:MAG: T9SS type A sorting domain-containing protein [Bacteroidia bacterium]|nr:T9SS type A sorting domain-containing protein [Bacteroidia bacterium]